LLAGPPGVGRRRLARWFASFVNCSAASEDQRPCGVCASCRDFAADVHVDIREVAPGAETKSGRAKQRREITIDQLVPRPSGDSEPLSEWLRSRPRHAYRVAVIEDADTLTESAANAFLKMLEEPPSWAVIILIAPGPDALLSTVASRAATVRLGPTWLPGFEDLAPIPALTLGQPGVLLRARSDAAGTEAARAAAGALLAALDGELWGLLEAAEAFAKAVTDAQAAGVSPGPLGWLLEPLRELGGERYAAGLDALAACQEALASYAPATLACTVLALELRSVFRRAAD